LLNFAQKQIITQKTTTQVQVKKNASKLVIVSVEKDD